MIRHTAGEAAPGNRRARLAGVVALAAVALLATGCGTSAPSAAAPTASATPRPTPTRTPTPAPTPAVEVPVQGTSPVAATATSAPVRLAIPAIDLDMPIVPVGATPSGAMELPIDPAEAGWYRFGADARSTAGNVVLAAHVDAPQYPIGPLARLRELAPGTSILVTGHDGTSRSYSLTTVTYYEKSQLPVDTLFARDGAPALVLITCGGEFDATTGHYRDNVVGVAVPT